MLAIAVTACSDYGVVAPTKNTENFYGQLKADHRAVVLSMEAPYNSIQVTATPYNIHGREIPIDTLTDYTHVTWESADTSVVGVSQTGVLTAKKVATRVNVYVTMAVGEITHRDTIWVGVTPTASSALDSLVLFVPSQKNVVAVGGTLALSVRARLMDGQIMANVPVSYSVSNRWLATFKSAVGLLYGLVPDDSVYVHATTTVYGVTRRDSIFLYTGWPLRFATRAFSLDAVLGNRNILYVPRITEIQGAPGSTFVWQNVSGITPKNSTGFVASGMKIDVIFDRPELAGAYVPNGPSGNILQLPYDTTRVDGPYVQFRKFTEPGDHYYTVEPFGVRGKVTISTR
jgi:hypothetical protein